MNHENYPALFKSADSASKKYQRYYFGLISAEYIILFCAAVLSLSFFETRWYFGLYAFVFILGALVLFGRVFLKYEQDWYKSRALAESAKTLTWRYMMRAEPFEDAEALQVPKKNFRDQLQTVFKANKAIAEKIDSSWSADAQVTQEMDRIRSLRFDERRHYYQTNRIVEQRGWYSRKASWNKRQAVIWALAAAIAYAAAIGLVVARIVFVEFQPWPIEPVIVFASCALGWMQIKKFNELAAAYTVTAHEIGFISPELDDAANETEMSHAVNEAELAFSREHTLWLARKTD